MISKIKLYEMVQGKINQATTDYLFYLKFKGNKKKLMLAKEQGWKIDVILCPIVMNVNVEHGDELKFPKRVVPLMIPAKLNLKGETEHADILPWIARKILNPTELACFAVGDIKDLDAFLSKEKIPPLKEGWKAFWCFTDNMVHKVTGNIIKEFSMNNYTQDASSYIVLNDLVLNSTVHLMNYYESMIKNKKNDFSPLITNLFNIKEKQHLDVVDDKKQYLASAKHMGQMGCEYPLSESQRETINHYVNGKKGDVFAVNGPPGTGKTTFLHTVISHEYVKAALKKAEPPIILATSNNNQAVTNIINSFSNVFDKSNILGQRWISGVDSFGSYLVSPNKQKEAAKKYQVIVPEKSKIVGFLNDIESEDYLNKASQYFLECASRYFQKKSCFSSIENANNAIHKKLAKDVAQIEETIQKVDELSNYIINIEKKYKPTICRVVEDFRDKHTFYEINKAAWDDIDIEFENWFKNFPFFKRIFMRMNVLNPIFIRHFSRFIDEHPLLVGENIVQSYKGIENCIMENRSKATKMLHQCNQKISEIKNDIKEISKIKDEIVNIGLRYDASIEYSDHIKDDINNALDMTLRYEAFRLATHYYEGKWIQEVTINIKEGYEDKKSKKKRKKQWRRIAKLTPCLVSTFYMIPKFMEHGYYNEEKVWIPDYLYDFIDILVVDEAGQASPEVCLPLFALAKKAVMVGDTYQIEPVWSVERFSDSPNMKNYVKDVNNEVFFESGYSAYNGNLMNIAKRRSNFCKYGEGGLYLTEHRRCIPEIIEYCNELAYKGKLNPRRKNNLKDFPFEHMGHLHVAGKSENYNSSRRNIIEAKAIENWIVNNAKLLLDYYNGPKSNDEKSIADIVAVVTPFKEQSRAIMHELRKNKGFENITVGTVHSLQGAERHIILFSSVYTERNKQSYFSDRGVNMLNVAVSRAKDSFVVIGDCRILDKKRNSPSGILARYLKYREYSSVSSRFIQ
ncbi:DEAD/DEAH box helicase [Crassaminicella profunda]|uniref:DEAD/DEAH box helicase n=1 Tax=Crassaminicella profunda TaxID=1286698 RepID=UPI001CA68A49|nr:DEAD/DEAH box helicase [Crassaminicella profunda]QZY54398.1 hypothetical protein K7H06_15320 [Crassaminicella profunda]